VPKKLSGLTAKKKRVVRRKTRAVRRKAPAKTPAPSRSGATTAPGA
jgi:hypothetical protein